MDHQPAPFRLAALLIALACTVSPACVNTSSERGVEPRWQEVGSDAFVAGTTTRADVLELLGPPSQIVSLKAETAFYYMLEATRSKGVILVVYNNRNERTRYDRAVFFFDAENVLTEHAFGE